MAETAFRASRGCANRKLRHTDESHAMLAIVTRYLQTGLENALR